MAGNFQDDTREAEMIELFDLRKDDSQGRSGIDAFLDIDGQSLPFELKTTSKGSVTTVRDFGPDHVTKWQNKHWLIGFYIGEDRYYKYASPQFMSTWISSKAEYIAPDRHMSDLAAAKLDLSDLYAVVGEKELYSYEDAKKLHKNQYNKVQYEELKDLEGGYSPERMLQIFKDRLAYVAQRGSTLNNPHIPFVYFAPLVKIEENFQEKLRELVRAELN
ncbi:hypothetical protein [Vibrio jasicida]|uniref:hypothetical protein n=1 Tax=Vibrio jasicida TaxID=766224 RepID=UPI00148C0F7A|nr:hypothetical protein [Vibrio jasicida]NOJ20094.1 hypothetical protein [Vibrio jasicida]